MQISDIHSIILQLLNSESDDYDNDKMLPYTRSAIAYVQDLRIQANDPDVITQATTTYANPITKPSDFFAFVPPKSQYPVIISDGKIKTTSSSFPQVTFKYAKSVARVTSITDTFPLPDEFAEFVAKYAKLTLANDNNNVDVSKDIELLDAEVQAFLKAKGG